MFANLGLGEVAILAVIVLFIFGPHRLPHMAAEAGRGLRQLRRMAAKARRDLQDDMGTDMADFDVTDLNPRTFVRKHLLEGLDDPDDLDDTHGYDPHGVDPDGAASATGSATATGRQAFPPKDKQPSHTDTGGT